jgi:hypothetical protein
MLMRYSAFTSYSALTSLSVALLVSCLTGCGSGAVSNSGGGSTQTVAPAITMQPSSVTVPISLSGIFHVSASGTSLNYQWSLNGTPVPNATSASYTTPAVMLTDTGAVYTVTISNSAGSVTSQPAILTAGARAPKNGDLRFQQVDSLNTVNGYGAGPAQSLPEDVSGALVSNAFGILKVQTDNCSYLLRCVLWVSAFAQPSGVAPLAVGFASGAYSNLESNLSTGNFASSGFTGGSILAPNTVVTGLELDPTDNLYGLSYMQTSQTGTFDGAQHTVNASQIQAAATTEGQASRVITAISYNSGQLTYFSYGWTGDTTTDYETLTATATFANAGTVASSLAAQGYIITAVGGDAADGVIFVGTRVHGDSLARPILVEQSFVSGSQLIFPEGYAIVGVVNDITTTPASGVRIGER